MTRNHFSAIETACLPSKVVYAMDKQTLEAVLEEIWVFVQEHCLQLVLVLSFASHHTVCNVFSHTHKSSKTHHYYMYGSQDRYGVRSGFSLRTYYLWVKGKR